MEAPRAQVRLRADLDLVSAMNVPGYNRAYIANPYVFADLNQPQRWRGSPEAVNKVFQTGEPKIRDVYLDAVVDALDEFQPPIDGAFVGAHMQPGTVMLGNYEDRSQRGGTLHHGQAVRARLRGTETDATTHPQAQAQLAHELKQTPLFAVKDVGWDRGCLLVDFVIRLNGTAPSAVASHLRDAARRVNDEQGADLVLEGLSQLSRRRAPMGDTTNPQVPDDFGEQMVQALFSEHPEQLVIQPPVRAPMWWERTYLGIPVWALAGLGVFALGTAGWAYRRRSVRRPR